MADEYPDKLPILPIVSDKQYPRSDDINRANRLVEAICAALGIAPKTITDVAAAASPASFAVAMDMFSNIVKTFTGATTWDVANVPQRRIFGGHGRNDTVGASTTEYVGLFQAPALTATENLTQGVIPIHCSIVSMYIVVRSAQPASGSLVFTLRKNGVDTSLVITVAAGAAAATNSTTGSVEFYPGDIISLKAANNATAASGAIASVTFEANQKG
jgi:hypothetical protein